MSGQLLVENHLLTSINKFCRTTRKAQVRSALWQAMDHLDGVLGAPEPILHYPAYSGISFIKMLGVEWEFHRSHHSGDRCVSLSGNSVSIARFDL